MKPVRNRLVVKAYKEPEKEKKGFIILPEEKNLSERMVIVAMGEECSPNFMIGDIVLLEKYAGQSITIDNEELFVVKEEQVIAIF